MSSAHLDPSKSEAVLDTSSELPKSSPFLDIPRELRNIIYSHLIAARDVAILRLSHQVCDEAKQVLYREGIFRLRLQDTITRKDLMVPESGQIPSKKVQNFSITIDLHEGGDIGNLNPDFQNWIQGPGECHVTLILKGYTCDTYAPSRTKSLIESLNNSKLVTLRLHFSQPYHPMDRRNSNKVKPTHTLGLEWMAKSFSTALGVPAWKSETCPGSLRTISDYVKAQQLTNPFPNAQYLEFYPRKQRQLAGGAD